jgi:hypothetical protein
MIYNLRVALEEMQQITDIGSRTDIAMLNWEASGNVGGPPEGIYARVANQVFPSVEAVERRPRRASERQKSDGGGAIVSRKVRYRGRPEKLVDLARASVSTSPSTIFSFPKPSSPEFFSRPEIFQPRGSQ